MNTIRNLLAALCLGLGVATPPSFAQTSISVSIGINVPAYPELVPVPGYPIYYAPSLPANYFFCDGLYWVYINDNWYDSVWYDGPWTLVAPEFVPVYILRVPVRYYRQPPVYFRAWAPQAPPRWSERWGVTWEQRHRGWDHWDRASAPPPAPPPTYQRQYAGDRYPRTLEQQEVLHAEHYRYQPKETVVRQRYERMTTQAVPPPQRAAMPPPRREERAAPPDAQGVPHERPAPGRGEGRQKDKEKDREEHEK